VSRLFVKVCGITRLQDAALAADLGASALGFVFWPGSPRYIGPAEARTIAGQLPPAVTRVGVFVNQAIEDVREVMDAVGLDVAQLHGEESPEYCRGLNRQVLSCSSTHTTGSATGARARLSTGTRHGRLPRHAGRFSPAG
jgi:phosphoribosylanthranilate isomerase